MLIENNEKLGTTLENLFDKTTGDFYSKSVLQKEISELVYDFLNLVRKPFVK